MPTVSRRHLLAACATLTAAPVLAQTPAAPVPSFTITARNQKFEPAELEVPAGQKIELRIVNAETRSIEFESKQLRREKVIAAGQTAIVFVGPLKPGRYEFENEFHPQTRGHLVVK